MLNSRTIHHKIIALTFIILGILTLIFKQGDAVVQAGITSSTPVVITPYLTPFPFNYIYSRNVDPHKWGPVKNVICYLPRVTDMSVYEGVTNRPWVWGPNVVYNSEAYVEAPGGMRTVAYWDKGRIEVTQPNTDPYDLSVVTFGSLTLELMSGRFQLGNLLYESHLPASIGVSNGLADNGTELTYAGFAQYATLTGKENLSSDLTGTFVTNYLTAGAKLGQYYDGKIQNQYYDQTTSHNIPGVFWTYLNQNTVIYDPIKQAYTTGLLFNWTQLLGHPLTEAYWTTVTIQGVSQTVLIQAFERRTIIYNPAKAPALQVEMGNVGTHYYNWRYQGLIK